MVAVVDCGKPGLRDPKMTAAMAWIESLPEGAIEAWKVQLTGCYPGGCPFAWDSQCAMVDGLQTAAPPPDACPLRSGGVLVVGAMP